MKVGITGHQDFASAEVQQWAEQQIRELISSHSVEFGITCLARGTDQIFARILLDYHTPYLAIIPSIDYEQTFPSTTERKAYGYLLSQAAEVECLCYSHASQASFFEASKKLVEVCDLVIAVWDGRLAKGFGGTADVVSFALAQQKPVLHINVLSRSVVQL